MSRTRRHLQAVALLPNALGDALDQRDLCPLLVLGQLVANLAGGKSTGSLVIKLQEISIHILYDLIGLCFPQSEIVFFLPVMLDHILECIDQQYSFPFPESLTIHNNIAILLNGNILPVKCIFISFHETPFSIGIFQNRSCQYSIFHSKTQICKFTLACIYHIIALGL